MGTGFDRLFIPRSWPTRKKGCVRPHSYCFIPAFVWGTYEASTATGSWRGTNALLLGVFQVTLFCPGPRRTAVKIMPRLLSGRQKLFQVYWVDIKAGWQIIPCLLSMRYKIFHVYWVCGKKYSTPTEYVVKIFHVYWLCGKKSPTSTEYAVKNLLRLLTMR